MREPRYYSGQFAVTPDLFHVTIPQQEIIQQMESSGEPQTLNDICLAVAVVADAICGAMEQADA